jgi:Ion channel
MRLLVQVLDIAVVLFAVRIVRAHAMFWRGGWIIAVPLVLLQLWHLLQPSRPVDLSLLCAQVLFHGYAVIMLLSYVMRDEVITLDELFALAGVYVLLALLWASAYGIVVWFNADAIFINPTNNPKSYVSFSDLVYFSLTTLSSTGYGEITPVSPAARALAMLQQWFGVLFVAMVIARMTSLYDRRPKG